MKSSAQVPSPGGTEQHDQNVLTAHFRLKAANKRLATWLIAFFVALVLFGGAWVFRWQAVEFHAGDRPAAALLINRLTGEMRYFQGNQWLVVQELKP